MTKCKNQFLMEDGFCTQCGENHFDRDDNTSKAAQNKRKRTPTAPTKGNIEDNINNTPVFKAARETVLLLSELFELEVHIVFRNRQDCYCEALNGTYHSGKVTDITKFQIIFGYKSLRRLADEGYSEYKSLRWMLPPGPAPTGAEAGVWIAMHEFAHAVDMFENGHTPGIAHKTTYIRIYREIIDLVTG